VGKWVSIKFGVTLRPALLMKKERGKNILIPGLSSAAQAKPQTHVTPNHNAVHLLQNRPHSTNNHLLNSWDF